MKIWKGGGSTEQPIEKQQEKRGLSIHLGSFLCPNQIKAHICSEAVAVGPTVP